MASTCVMLVVRIGEHAMSDTRQYVHELIDQLDAGQLAAVGQLLEVMTDPVARSLVSAPVETEPISEQEATALDQAHAAIARGVPPAVRRLPHTVPTHRRTNDRGPPRPPSQRGLPLSRRAGHARPLL